jgi:ABC-type bacteriocin/lantibiotic exporter with double-glycine peptidase domain
MEKICFNVDGRPLLTDLSFSLQKGDILGITGESGKGKTTILNILLGFTQPLKGQITVNEKAAAPLELQRYWRQIAYVPQQTFLFHDTLRRNITMEEQPASLQKLQDALQATGIAETPDELDKDGRKAISENGRNISGGQGQRIAFARALYRDADLVLLDEAFNELDEFAEQTMLELVHQLALDGKIVILVSHNRRCLHFCNKILSLDGQKEIISYPNAGISRN